MSCISEIALRNNKVVFGDTIVYYSFGIFILKPYETMCKYDFFFNILGSRVCDRFVSVFDTIIHYVECKEKIMGIKTGITNIHWNYHLTLEDDLIELSRFIEFHEANFECFSLQISRILMAASAEVDVVCKQLCKKLNSKSKASSINPYMKQITTEIPDISNFSVQIPRYGIKLKPWNDWAKLDVPEWWTANNKVKHHRHKEFQKGNLKNLLNAVSGLFVMVLYLYKEAAELGELIPQPKLLRVDEAHFNGTTFIDYEFGVNYLL